MSLHDPNKSKTAKITLPSDEVILYPHPNINSIYQCYAFILSASVPIAPSSTYLNACLTDTPNQYKILNNLALLYYSQIKPVKVKIILLSNNVLDWNEIKYQLSTELLQYIQQLKIDIHKVDPKQLLRLLNQHLSRQAIYDFNVRIYDKPHAQLSFQTLAFLLSCSRNQLTYRQHQIDRAYNDKYNDLGQKCFALRLQRFNSRVFWEM